MNKKLFTIACILGALTVILGAFGAHLLKEKLTAAQLVSYNTGISYQFYHVGAALLCCLFAEQFKIKGFNTAGWLFIVGIVCFSGSIYLLNTRELIGLTTYKWLGPITPIGGLFFIGGWLMMLFAGLKIEGDE